MDAYVEYDGTGAIRIRIDNTVGEWAPYGSVAMLEYNHTMYVALSRYYEGGVVPVETILHVDAVPTKPAVHV